LARYKKNRLRVVPEVTYSPWATAEHLAETGVKAKEWRIDLVLFVNGIPVALELKSEFKQAVHNAMRQYRTTRLPVDPVTKKPEPLLTFKRGALVHFAVSQYEVYMTTRLEAKAPSSYRLTKVRRTARAMMHRRRTNTRPTICGMKS
jgi:type I restriction enzyme R subunit